MEKTKKPLSTGRKLLYLALAAAAIVGLCYLAYYLLRFTWFDRYTQYLSSYTYEDGMELQVQKKSLPGYKNYKLVTESDCLELYLNQKTSDVAVLDKRSGEVTFAAPPDADDDPVANASNRNYLKSHIIVNYFNASRKEGIYDSYSMAVERDQVRYESLEKGLRVIYQMGDFSNSMGLVPMYMSKEKFEEISAALPQSDAEAFARYYTENSDVSGMRQLLKAARNNKNTKKKLTAMFEAVGFTEEDCVEQMALAGSAVSVPISVTVPLEYRLEDDHLDVSVPVCGIAETGGASVFRIQLLRNFGAQDSTGSGYLVVPNGDGSIIHFNNGKTNIGAGNYSQFVYGIELLAADYTVLENSNDVTMSLFGLCKENATILATIEDGASLASITEPLDFMFCFSAPILWVAHACISGLFIVLLHIFHVTGFTTNLLGSVLMNLSAGADKTNYPTLYLLALCQIAVYFVVFTLLIKAFNLHTPGREEVSTETAGSDAPAKKASVKNAAEVQCVIDGLGGKENILSVDNCFTRLRVNIKDPAKLDEAAINRLPNSGIVKKGTDIQIVYGLQVADIKRAVEAQLENQ